MRGKERIGPAMMVVSSAPTALLRPFAQNTSQSCANPAVDSLERRVVTVLEITEPASQRTVDVLNDAFKRTPVGASCLGTQSRLELGQALLPRPAGQSASPGPQEAET